MSQYKIYTAQVRPPSASLTIQEKEEIAVQYSGCEFPFHTQFGILTQTTWVGRVTSGKVLQLIFCLCLYSLCDSLSCLGDAGKIQKYQIMF